MQKLKSRMANAVAVTVVVGAIGSALRKRFSLSTVRATLIACWIVFYAWFLTIMPG